MSWDKKGAAGAGLDRVQIIISFSWVKMDIWAVLVGRGAQPPACLHISGDRGQQDGVFFAECKDLFMYILFLVSGALFP